MSRWWRAGWPLLGKTLLAMINYPDYARYLAHHRHHHPERPPLSEAAFIRARQEARYGGGAGHTPRCC
ncbi:MAG: putative selenoprotein [Magnetococcales bacterium]|nr:putative selenoprotein [Magnetococcales bacterium]